MGTRMCTHMKARGRAGRRTLRARPLPLLVPHNNGRSVVYRPIYFGLADQVGCQPPVVLLAVLPLPAPSRCLEITNDKWTDLPFRSSYDARQGRV